MLKIYNDDSLDIFYKIINENYDKKIIIVSDPRLISTTNIILI